MAVTANPNIIMGFRPPEIQNPMAIAAQGEQIRSARTQNKLAQAKIDAMPAEAQQAFNKRAMEVGKDLLARTGSAQEFNVMLNEVMGGDASAFHIKSDENFQAAQNKYYPQKSGAKPQIIQDASGSYTIDPETYEATKIKGVGGKTFAPQKPTPDKLTLGGDESGQYIINMNTGEKTPVLGVKSSPVKPVVASETTANEAQDAIVDIDVLLGQDLGVIYGQGESLYPDRIRSQEGIDMMATRDRIANSLVLARMGQMKGLGPVSDSDGVRLEKAASALKNQDISPAKAAEELRRIKPIFERSMIANRPKQQTTQPTQLPPVNANGWKLRRNKTTGEQAYFGPDGEIERVQ